MPAHLHSECQQPRNLRAGPDWERVVSLYTEKANRLGLDEVLHGGLLRRQIADLDAPALPFLILEHYDQVEHSDGGGCAPSFQLRQRAAVKARITESQDDTATSMVA